jgi:glycerol-3-phosphate acyltransferase PlsY
MGEIIVSVASILFGGIFSVLPAVLLASRFFWRRPRWWVILPVIVVVGWAAYFLSVATHFEELQDLVRTTENPSQDLVDEAYSDGGPLVFAAFFGWLVALVYALPWFVIFLVATSLRNLIRRLHSGEG